MALIRPAFAEYIVTTWNASTRTAAAFSMHGHTSAEISERAAATVGPLTVVTGVTYAG